MDYGVGIVAAGFGGFSDSRRIIKKGISVAPFEASNELGGSAGKFDREGYRFQS